MGRFKIIILLMIIQSLSDADPHLHNNYVLQELLQMLLLEHPKEQICVIKLFNESDKPLTNVNFYTIEDRYIPVVILSENSTNIFDQFNTVLTVMNMGCSNVLLSSVNVPLTVKLIVEASEQTTQRKPIKLIVLDTSGEDLYFGQISESQWLKYFPYTYFISATNISSDSQINEYVVFSHSVGNNLEPETMEVLAVWTPNKSGEPLVRMNKMLNLNNKTMNLIMFPYSPATIAFENSTEYEGTDYRLMVEFSKLQNFSWNIDLVTNYGSPFENESTSSFCGNIKAKEYHAAIPIGAMSDYFNDNYYLSYPHSQGSVTFLVPRPKLKDRLWSIFFPFTTSVWFIILGWMFFSSICFYILSVLHQKVRDHDKFIPYTSFSYSLLYSFSIFLGLSVTCEGHYLIKQLLIYCFSVSIILTTAYNCNLVSYLTIPFYESKIDTLEQFVQSGLKWGTFDMIYPELLDATNDHNAKIISTRYLLLEDSTEINEKVGTGTIAYIVETFPSGYIGRIELLDEEVLKKIYLMKESVISYHSCFMFFKGSPFVEHFNKYLSRVRDSGILFYWEADIVRNYIPRKTFLPLQNDNLAEEGLQPLSMDDLKGAFLVVSIGLLLASMCFLIERFCKHSFI